MATPELERFAGAGGVSLAFRSWLPPALGRALLVVVHGVTEHSARYLPFAQGLASARIGVYAFDLRGHGCSSGHRGHVEQWQDYISDLHLFLNDLRRKHPQVPIFCFGHSLGALIVLSYLLQHAAGIQGAVVCGIPIEPVGVARPSRVALARLFSRVWPTFPIKIRVEGRATLSRDPKVEADFHSDPLVFKHVTARFGIEALAAVESVRHRAHSLKLPLLIVHGGADPLNVPQGAQWLCNAVGSSDKQLIIYPGSYHEPHNDLDRDKMLRDVREWVDRRGDRPTPISREPGGEERGVNRT